MSRSKTSHSSRPLVAVQDKEIRHLVDFTYRTSLWFKLENLGAQAPLLSSMNQLFSWWTNRLIFHLLIQYVLLHFEIFHLLLLLDGQNFYGLLYLNLRQSFKKSRLLAFFYLDLDWHRLLAFFYLDPDWHRLLASYALFRPILIFFYQFLLLNSEANAFWLFSRFLAFQCQKVNQRFQCLLR